MNNPIIKFYSKSSYAKCLSNFSDFEIIIKNKIFQTGEHAFHGLKYSSIAGKTKNKDRKKILLSYSEKFEGISPIFNTPNDAKKGGGKKGLLLEPLELEYWNNISYQTQKNISEYKFQTYQIVKETLLENKNSYLLHQDNRANNNTLWGGRIDKRTGNLVGYNKLGLVWMEIAKGK